MFQDIGGILSTTFRPDCLREPKESRERQPRRRPKQAEALADASEELQAAGPAGDEEMPGNGGNHLDIRG
jgi:hypothetical protein